MLIETQPAAPLVVEPLVPNEQAIIDWINWRRAALGRAPIKTLARATHGLSRSANCPIANSLGDGHTVAQGVVIRESRVDYDIPEFVDRFITQFDHGAYPHLGVQGVA